jgi:REP element-mobilizing transposase RayT
MPRIGRIDAPGALHHIIIRGIEKKPIFLSDTDRDRFTARLGKVLTDTVTPCYAWALMPNHAHLLLRTGVQPIATVMRRLLTGYAQDFNRQHNRHGQLFQNRYKSILCEEDPYLLELVRYIHLNLLRAGIVRNLGELKAYCYSGHAALMGTMAVSWQDTRYVLRLFGSTDGQARRKYESFAAGGVARGRRPELTGGGLIRSSGGWSQVKIQRLQGIRKKADERILGADDFVETVLQQAQEELEQSASLRQRGLDMDELVSCVADFFDVDSESLKEASKQRTVVKARSLFCYLALRKLRMNGTEVARKLNVTQSAVSKLVAKGQAEAYRESVESIIKQMS